MNILLPGGTEHSFLILTEKICSWSTWGIFQQVKECPVLMT